MQVMLVSSICQRKFLAAVATILLFFIGEVSAMDMELKGKLVFSTQHEIYVVKLDARRSWKSPERIPLPGKSDTVHHPSWMPGGDGVIFEYGRWPDDNGQITNCLAVMDLGNKKKPIPFEQHLLPQSGTVSYPKWSPNGEMFGYLEHEETRILQGKHGAVEGTVQFNKLVIFERKTRTLKSLCQNVAYFPFSWSPDSKKIVYTSSDGMITLCRLEGGKTFVGEGRYPLCHPVTGDIYYVGPDTHLYKASHDGEKRLVVDNGDWSWRVLIDISKDGKSLFFIGGGSRFFFLSEYATIGVFNLVSHKEKTLSKKYAIIHGASLFQD